MALKWSLALVDVLHFGVAYHATVGTDYHKLKHPTFTNYGEVYQTQKNNNCIFKKKNAVHKIQRLTVRTV